MNDTTTEAEVVADLFQPREGRDLIWKGLSVTLAPKGKDDQEIKILNDVWGAVPAGQVTAILGPSGSGKSTLLNVLSGRTQTGGRLFVESDVRLNDFKVDPTDLTVRKKIAFVAQDDSLQVTSTPREAIHFSAKLRLPKSMSDEEITALTNRVLAELGLEDCADTLVGGALVKGISGGERKRTSVAIELVSRPALVFLDEPTSGLDSFNAGKLCKILSKIAKAGSSVLFTIHQPSSEIFSEFDYCILLNKGRVMYQGATTDVTGFFSERGYPCPTHYNPADYIMNVAAAASLEELEQCGFFPKDTRPLGEVRVSTNEPGKDFLGITSRGGARDDDPSHGFLIQAKLLFKRELLNIVRDTHALKTRTKMTLVISFVTGFLFFQIAEAEYTEYINIQSTFGALLMSLIATMLSTALPSLMAFPAERPVFLREYQTNHYSVAAYFISRLTMEVGITGIQVTMSSMVTYLLCGFTMRYGMFWAALYLMALASTALGVFVGSSVENPATAVEYLPVLILPQILFSGFFVPQELMPNWLAWIQYICPLTYAVWIVTAKEFGDGQCDDLDDGSSIIDNCEKILNNIASNPDDTWWYFLVLLSMFVGTRLVALVNLKRKASKFY